MSKFRSIVTVGKLFLALVCSIFFVAPQATAFASVHSALTKLFSETYLDFSNQDLSMRLVSLSDMTTQIQSLVDAYFAAPSHSVGQIRHLIEGEGIQLPTLSIGYRPNAGSIVEIKIPLEFNLDSAATAVGSVTKTHPGDCILTVNLRMSVIAETHVGLQVWDGEWSGTVDVHHSFMTLRGRFSQSKQEMQWTLIGLSVAWIAVSAISWVIRSSLLDGAIGILHICAAGSCLLFPLGTTDFMLDVSRLLVATACFASCNVLSWFTMQSILPSVCIAQRALSTASGHLWWYVVGVAPIFFAFAVAGSILFAVDEKNFGTVSRSFVTLFCSVFGDSLIDIFTTMDEFSSSWTWWLTARFFFCCFLGLFITTILNVALSVMQDSVAVSEHKFILAQNSSHQPVTKEVCVDKILDLLA
ncbi:membrane-associated protein, putative [Bodo saltans]|uniref:Membrane-associated protein, putative n=1 Tax=Bodo saltans TaxID=75058 RepID=A0A0S4ILM0_BODSA|nr:membrane-associated protein, putative [Bodo saltans]|eukprot:CUE70788.1 membrane-associated protein, putative [Bodo saltans]